MHLILKKKSLLVKRVLAFVLVLALLFIPMIKEPVKVEAIVPAVPVIAGAAIVAAAMSALGIGFAASMDTTDLSHMLQQTWDNLTDDVRNGIVLTELGGTTVAHFTSDALKNIFNSAKETIPQNPTLPANWNNSGSFGSISAAISFFEALGMAHASNMFVKQGELDTWNLLGQGIPLAQFSNYRVISTYTVPTPTYDFAQNVSIPVLTGGAFNAVLSGTWAGSKTAQIDMSVDAVDAAGKQVSSSNASPWKYTTSGSASFSNSAKFAIGSQWVIFLVDRIVDGVTHTYTCMFTLGDADVIGAGLTNDLYGRLYVDSPEDVDDVPAYGGQDVFNPVNDGFFADGVSSMTQPVQDVIDRLLDRVGEKGQVADQPDVVTIPADIIGDRVTDDTKTADQTGTIGRDISTPADKAADDAANDGRDIVTPKPSTLPDLTIPQIITRKFPFSIPWDLYNAVHILVAPPAAPKWDIGFHFDRLGIHETTTIDLSQFDTLATIIRWGIAFLFLISLIILTSHLIKR
ncbi:conserved membrane protein of unknown function [Ruminococcaceae bacterium BL-6]|nr:conserved membrane protein of unknown function [Ruminococcaceae bacterium BL-6]CAB1248003.1 conserved membrane protein of unknown function [Ruminococcaceae bacterium BL-6]